MQFSVEEEVAMHATGAPPNAVSPTSDLGLVFVKDEDVSTSNHNLPVGDSRATAHSGQESFKTGFKEHCSIVRACNKSDT